MNGVRLWRTDAHSGAAESAYDCSCTLSEQSTTTVSEEHIAPKALLSLSTINCQLSIIKRPLSGERERPCCIDGNAWVSAALFLSQSFRRGCLRSRGAFRLQRDMKNVSRPRFFRHRGRILRRLPLLRQRAAAAAGKRSRDCHSSCPREPP